MGVAVVFWFVKSGPLLTCLGRTTLPQRVVQPYLRPTVSQAILNPRPEYIQTSFIHALMHRLPSNLVVVLFPRRRRRAFRAAGRLDRARRPGGTRLLAGLNAGQTLVKHPWHPATITRPGRRHLELLRPHVGVEAAGRGEQLGVRAALGDLPVFQHEDLVRVHHGGEPVRNAQRRAALADARERVLDRPLRLRVQRRRRLVQLF